MKNLVIVESPSKSKTIAKYLGKDFDVISSKGHIRDLAIKGKDGLGVDVDHEFEAVYEISKDKKDTVRELQAAVAKADRVYLATDPDREGEAISWHLAQELGLSETETDRVTFNEITKSAVTEAFLHPRTIDMALVHSQETRRILDRIIGFKLSKLLKNKIKSKSAGRVQSVALKLIVDREKEIEAFVPQEYWTLDAEFIKDDIPFKASLAKINGKKANLTNEEDALKAYNACLGPFTVTEIRKSNRSRKPLLPFITSTLQQEASTKLNFAAKRTMSIAQKLYEGIDIGNGAEGLITYMRTDSTRLSETFRMSAKELIKEKYGDEYAGFYREKNDGNAQDAHEAIRPTSLANDPETIKPYLTNEQYRLYKLIYARALASQMKAPKYDSIAVTLSENGYDFSANGSTLTFDGYLKVYKDYDASQDVILPKLDENETISATSLRPNQHFTEPPARYTEAKLIKAMEEDGIGRPSTYAMIIDTIQQRGYVTLERSTASSRTKVFRPTPQGVLTTEKLDDFFSTIINVTYTAEMESKLDEIADGKREEVPTLRDFYDQFSKLLEDAYEKMEKMQPEPVGETCPECGNELVYRVGKFGKFISCSNYPECSYRRGIEDENKEKPEPTGKACPECGSELLKRKSRFGTYFCGCSSFPKCNYMETLEGVKIEPKVPAKRKSTAKTTKKSTKAKTTKKTTAKKTTGKAKTK